jgi:hypothetical protein
LRAAGYGAKLTKLAVKHLVDRWLVETHGECVQATGKLRVIVSLPAPLNRVSLIPPVAELPPEVPPPGARPETERHRAQGIRAIAADIRQSASNGNGPTAIKDLVGILIKARQQGGLFTGAEYAELRALLDHPDRWPFRSEFGAETALVGNDVRLAVGHAIACFFLPPADGVKMMGMMPTDTGDNAVAPEDVLRDSPMLLWAYWTRALQAVADRLDEEAKRIDNNGQDFIERLLAGPDDAELTARELALLAAHLHNNRPHASWWQRQNRSEKCPELERYQKLKTILDFNRHLQAALAPTAPIEQSPPSPTRELVLRQLEPAVRKAYLAYQYAEGCAEKRLEDREAYDWLRENGIDQGKGDLGELTDYDLPDSLETFRRYLGTARNSLGESKYTPRGGRKHGRSIARANEIDYQQGDGR